MANELAKVNKALKRKDNGAYQNSIDNFLAIMENDSAYAGIRFNLMSGVAEVHTISEDGDILINRWTDVDDAYSRAYIERKYSIYHAQKHSDALRLLFHKREYNPIVDLIEALEWDGKNRIESFLSECCGAEKNDYVAECSRLIFAGGINRLYQPGCKFDDVVVLCGEQGSGKSSIIRFLAIQDQYFAEIKEKVDSDKAIEQLQGAWICEIPELAALQRTKEVETVKAFITRQKDRYRRPYDTNVSDMPRRAVFIGSSNKYQFLTDLSGNRRFYPVQVHVSGYDLFDHEESVREYIKQCWAEAKERYAEGNMPAYARKELLHAYREAQDNALQDDWRIGAIETYLDSLPVGYNVCVREIKHKALSIDPAHPSEPTPKDSTDIGLIMSKFAEWVRVGSKYTEHYGKQRCWQKQRRREQKINEY